MKFLVRGRGDYFEEAVLDPETGEFKPNHAQREVDPGNLVHFGTDLVEIVKDGPRLSLDKSYLSEIERHGVAYIQVPIKLVFGEKAPVTAYLKKGE